MSHQQAMFNCSKMHLFEFKCMELAGLQRLSKVFPGILKCQERLSSCNKIGRPALSAHWKKHELMTKDLG
eukprot:scaffold96609_cov16-Tisochrysis_lutea.AAC.1